MGGIDFTKLSKMIENSVFLKSSDKNIHPRAYKEQGIEAKITRTKKLSARKGIDKGK